MGPKAFRKGLITAFALLLTAADAPPAPPPLTNMDFEQGEVGQRPPGWWGKSITTSADSPQGGSKSLLLRNDDKAEFETFAKDVDAAPFRGQTVRFRASVRSTSPGGAGLWLRVDGPQRKMLFLDNMTDRLVRKPDWTWAEIVVDVPEAAEHIVFGGNVFGPGTAGFDTASFEVVPASTDPIAPEAKAELEEALSLLQTRHINRDRVDWPTFRVNAKTALAHAQTTAAAYRVIQEAINALGEKHTFLRLPPARAADGSLLGPEPAPVAPTARTLGRGVVELALPGTWPRRLETLKPYQETLSAEIRRGRRAGACGWIVDLREDAGGAAWIMVDGLAALLGPPPYGGFRDANGDLYAWTWKDGAVVRPPVKAMPAPAKGGANLQPVAVLLGPHTASAGETAALAFAGRRNARSFGAPTAGRTTGNSAFPLPDGAELTVTDMHLLDRTGRTIEGPLLPDEPIPLDQAETAALAWLSSRGCW